MVVLEGFADVIQEVPLTSGELLGTTPRLATMAGSPLPLPHPPAVSVALW